MGRLATRRNVLLLSLLLALLSSMLIYKFLRSQSEGKTLVTVPVVVSNCDIEARKIVKPDQVLLVYRPSKDIDDEMCSSLDDVVGKATLSKIPKGSVVTHAALGEPSVKLGLSYAIPEYMRAITIAVDDVSGVAGFLKPGDHVDVIGAFEEHQKSTAKTVLQDVELLAIGPEVGQEKVGKNSGKAKSDSKTTATLVVAPEDAERLVLADTQGKLRLVLRSQGDVLRVVTEGAEGSKVTGIPEQKQRESTVHAASAPRPSYDDRPPRAYHTPQPVPSAARPRRSSPTTIPAKKENTAEVKVYRGDKEEVVEVEDTDKTSTRNPKEVAGTSPSSL